jgi:hypothetical protein
VGDACVDPSHRIGDIRTVNGDFITDKEILRDIFLHPFTESVLLLDGPSTISHFPYLKRRFLHALCEGWDGEEEDEEGYQKPHSFILKKLGDSCQQGRARYLKQGNDAAEDGFNF